MNSAQFERYSRHITLSQIGVEGQKKLLAARVLLVGVGGLGSPAALYLAAAGVGTLGLVDSDVVDLSNLQRQVLHDTLSVGRPKLESARARLLALNPDLNVILHPGRLTSATAMEIISAYDLVVDGSDNFPTRYLTNDACVLLGKANVYGAIHHFDGQASVFHSAAGGPCYRCIFPEPPPPGAVPSCAEAGVLGALPGIIGTLQATEAIKLTLGLGEPLIGRLLLYDALKMDFRTIKLRANPDCSVCGKDPVIRTLVDYELFCGQPCSSGGGGIVDSSISEPKMTVQEVRAMLRREPDLPLLDVRNPDEYAAGHIVGARLIPLAELADRLEELESLRSCDFVVYCKSGGRSAQACTVLKAAGFSGLHNMSGGYLAWVATADEL